MKFIIYLGILALISCSIKKKDQNQETVNGLRCIPYFNFDSVDHYRIQISENEVWNYLGKKHKTDYDRQKFNLLVGNAMTNLADTPITMNLETFKFRKQTISTDAIERLRAIFCERSHEESFVTTCEPVFRDILVFKDKGKITGIANICFDCNKALIIGSFRNTLAFGQSGDYQKLYAILQQ